MADIVSRDVRSRMMASIRSRDTKPELLVRRYLHGLGFRYRLTSARLPGRPDLVLSRYKAVIFVHGCFWHGHEGCRFATVPSTRREFWQTKINGTKVRDARSESSLFQQGWRVAIIWECALRLSPEESLNELSEFVISREESVEISGAS
jgi:DNA mismatch endonuclease (patch repair protein)